MPACEPHLTETSSPFLHPYGLLAAAFIELELQEPSIQLRGGQFDSPFGLEADAFGQQHIARVNVSPIAATMLLHIVANRRVGADQLLFVAQTLTVLGIEDDDGWRRRQGRVLEIANLGLDVLGDACRFGIDPRYVDGFAIVVGGDDLQVLGA